MMLISFGFLLFHKRKQPKNFHRFTIFMICSKKNQKHPSPLYCAANRRCTRKSFILEILLDFYYEHRNSDVRQILT